MTVKEFLNVDSFSDIDYKYQFNGLDITRHDLLKQYSNINIERINYKVIYRSMKQEDVIIESDVLDVVNFNVYTPKEVIVLELIINIIGG